MTFNLGRWKWANTSLRRSYARATIPRIAGISGGSTSAMLAALVDDGVLLSFQNTGREAKRTYEFLEELEDGLRRPIVWLEYRPPLNPGGAPCESGFAVVDAGTCDRSGGPFEMLMEALRAFRRANGKGPIAPWWRSRICTTYMKTRTARAYVESLGWSRWNELVGLRADEPDRVDRLRVGVPKRIGREAPLFELGVTKADVDEFWEEQPFSLGLPAYMGNCTGCFLKDQADLSRALAHVETDAGWWSRMEGSYPGWGGANFAGYEVLAAETDDRLRIEEDLGLGRTPRPASTMDEKRFRLVVIQEKKRFEGLQKPFACGCEGVETLASMDEDEEERWILSLPEAS